jgi:class 3 adenylate cyclase
MISLPKDVRRRSALLFVDMSGFTKLSTILDVESLSKVINM